MSEPHLVYFADPMCSWCWGFSPVIGEIRARFGGDLPIRLVMGGLRPGTTEPLDDDRKREIRAHWQHVHEASGQPFDFAFFDREGFVYDTDPAARATVAARRLGAETPLDFLSRVQNAFYAESRDTTDPEVLADIAAEFGLARDRFAETFADEETLEETRLDYSLSRSAGITGFPSLIAGRDGSREYAAVTIGYQPAERVLPLLERWLEQARA